ncbi:MAG: hypothetical protein AAGI07_04550 [Bacteroidota bacterium]
MKFFLQFIILSGIFAACQSHEYYDTVEKELASGVRYDSLFLDIKFGMRQKEFFTHCWELNKKGVITNGSKNMSVLYRLDEELKDAGKMNFYPEFYDNKIYKMPVIFSYEGWAPWNEHLSADTLLVDVVALLKKWYGDDFITVSHEKKGTAYIKVDGNRRIAIYKKSESEVEAMFTDLLIEKTLKEKKL